MEREAFNRVVSAGQLTWEQLHPTEFIYHPDTPEENKRLDEKLKEAIRILKNNSQRPPGSSYF